MSDTTWTARAPDPDTRGEAQPRPRHLVAASLAAATVEIARHTGITSLGATVAGAALAALVLTTRRRPSDWAWALGVSAIAVGASVTSATWLLSIDLVAVITALALMACRPLRGQLTSASVAGGCVALGRNVPAVVASTVRQVRTALPVATPDRRNRVSALLRAGAIAAPMVLSVAILLISADGVIRSWFSVPEIDSGVVLAVVTIAAAWWAGLVLVRSHLDPGSPRPWTRWRPGPLDAVVTMGGVAGVLAVYCTVRVAATLAGERYVTERTGVTFAEYARSGFFQLLAAAAITIAAVLLSRAVDGTVRVLRLLRCLTCAADLALVACALHGFALYRSAYGLTRLRVLCIAVLIWIALVVIVVLVGEVRSRWRRHTISAAAAAGAAVLVVLNSIRPDLLIARTNLALARREGRVDVEYLARLSPDAAPALGSATEILTADQFEVVSDAWCTTAGTWLAWNLSEARAGGTDACPDYP